VRKLTLALLVGVAVLGGPARPAPTVQVGTALVLTPALQEDSPGWDCRVDGNRRCGPKAQVTFCGTCPVDPVENS